MTKDEARCKALRSISQWASGICAVDDMEADVDAYAQAAAEDALDVERRTQIVMEANHDEGQYEEDADTLGMLEALAKRYGFAQTFIAKWDYLEVHWAGANFLYSGEDGEPEISRAEAEALLGKGKAK